MRDRPERPVHFVCADRFGREVVAFEDLWYDHVLVPRPTMAGREAAVIATIEGAEQIRLDRHHDNRRCYYRRGVLPPPNGREYLKVVVEFGPVGPDGVQRGILITAFPTEHVHPRERREA